MSTKQPTLSPGKRIAVYMTGSKISSEDAIAVNLFEELSRHFKVTYFFPNKPQDYLLLERFDTYICKQPVSSLRRRLSEFLFHLDNFRFNLRDQPDLGYKAGPIHFLGLSKKYKLILYSILRCRFDAILVPILKWALNLTAPRYFAVGQFSKLVSFSASKDPQNDDLARNAKRVGIPILNVQINWDNAASKVFLVKPDLILSWGNHSSQLIEKRLGIRAFTVGTPRFVSYTETDLFQGRTRDDICQELHLDPTNRYILVAGSGIQFGEISLIRRIIVHMKSSGLTGIKILYRPHPYPWKRKLDDQVTEIDNIPDALIDPTTDSRDRLSTASLFSIISGFITPWSTMVIDATLSKVPTMVVSYDIPSYPTVYWYLRERTAKHRVVFQNAPFLVRCRDEEMVEKNFDELIKLMNNKLDDREYNRISHQIVYHDGNRTKYVERLIKIIKQAEDLVAR